jgi:antitoxin (DNA-binding transcriptional repressor) of toxin-antitoxin stability system
MSVPTPEWITRHAGELRESKDGHAWTVYFRGEPQYLLIPLPAEGRYTCRVSQTVNGRRLDKSETYPDRDAAVRGGLEVLRAALGW